MKLSEFTRESRKGAPPSGPASRLPVVTQLPPHRRWSVQSNTAKDAGFTLLEIMIVVVLAGLGVAIALPRAGQLYSDRATRTAADAFRTTHSLAASVGVRFGRLAELHIDASNARFWVEVDTSQTGGVKDTVGAVKYLADSKITLMSNRSLLCFDARGLPTTRGACQAADATLTFSMAGAADTVKVTSMGQVVR